MELLQKLKTNPSNPRTIKKEEFECLKNKIKAFPEMLEKRPIVYDREIVLGGNQRLQVLKDLVKEGFEVKESYFADVTGWTEEQKRQFVITDNISDGEWDYDILANEWSDLPLDEWGIETSGWDSGELEEEGEPIKDLKDIKILNLYSSIGGNRKLWGNLDIIAVEYNEEIAAIYRDYFPNDKVIVGDAHKYLEEHFGEYDFIWASPPCPTHSLLRKGLSMAAGAKAVYPDMRLWQEILFLQGYFKGKWVVENVVTWYDPLIEPQERGRHYYWSNFDIPDSEVFNVTEIGNPGTKEYGEKSEKYGFNLDKYKVSSKYPKEKILRDIVHPKAG